MKATHIAMSQRDLNISTCTGEGTVEEFGRLQDFCTMTNWLVVEPYPSEKYEFVSWDDKNRKIWNIMEQ